MYSTADPHLYAEFSVTT